MRRRRGNWRERQAVRARRWHLVSCTQGFRQARNTTIKPADLTIHQRGKHVWVEEFRYTLPLDVPLPLPPHPQDLLPSPPVLFLHTPPTALVREPRPNGNVRHLVRAPWDILQKASTRTSLLNSFRRTQLYKFSWLSGCLSTTTLFLGLPPTPPQHLHLSPSQPPPQETPPTALVREPHTGHLVRAPRDILQKARNLLCLTASEEHKKIYKKFSWLSGCLSYHHNHLRAPKTTTIAGAPLRGNTNLEVSSTTAASVKDQGTTREGNPRMEYTSPTPAEASLHHDIIHAPSHHELRSHVCIGETISCTESAGHKWCMSHLPGGEERLGEKQFLQSCPNHVLLSGPFNVSRRRDEPDDRRRRRPRPLMNTPCSLLVRGARCNHRHCMQCHHTASNQQGRLRSHIRFGNAICACCWPGMQATSFPEPADPSLEEGTVTPKVVC